MSYRDTRITLSSRLLDIADQVAVALLKYQLFDLDFTEMLRTLGYPKLVSMESFRTPNFPLVADLLVWLSKRFDPESDIPLTIETEEERIALIRSAAQFMAIKANIKLNNKRLYQADGYAVKELLKITSMLYEALQVNVKENEEEDDEESINIRDFDISDKINDLKQSRQLASEITESGATLYDLLGQEADIRSLRYKSAGRQFEVNEVENGIKAAIEAIKRDISETTQLIENVSATEANLDSKIERRKIEIDRYEKRLQTLKKVKPAFLEEFTALESELEQLFNEYSLRLRCLNHLEHLTAEAERAHLERQKLVALHKVVETVPLDREEPTELFSLEDMSQQEQKQEIANKQERPRARTGRLRSERSSKLHSVLDLGVGSISGSSLDLSSDTGSDDLFLDKDEPELGNSEDDSLGLELSGMDKTAFSGRKTSNNIQNINSDDDF